ncbi:hypothetical protein [Solimicrobium silvestre]|uniref:Uncharacterized protein n=1 Tax=Solimicrobium silvestre TaxID=2099400 RepID=A0A2S9GZW9_9BURK|nr:hypothetical protein [Solimicrobium silvestre]PRC93285.1 hypothetical protein S2091_2023 [Solimicrobium silvestre]
MNADLKNFREWYVYTLNGMYPRRESGIAVFILSLPLLERYLRQKNGLTPSDGLSDACMTDLYNLFGALANVQVARKFWNVYRNGFLHEATLSLKTSGGKDLPVGVLSHDIQDAITVEANGSFLVHPVLFSQCVIQVIEKNFAVFSGAGTSLPTVNRYKLIPEPPSGPHFYEGTSAAWVPKKP